MSIFKKIYDHSPSDFPRNCRVVIHLTTGEKARIEKLAKDNNKSVSSFLCFYIRSRGIFENAE